MRDIRLFYIKKHLFFIFTYLQTYNLNTQVPDSASTATAYLAGSKANHYTIGLKGTTARDNCTLALDKNNHVHSVASWAQWAGKETGTGKFSVMIIFYLLTYLI